MSKTMMSMSTSTNVPSEIPARRVKGAAFPVGQHHRVEVFVDDLDIAADPGHQLLDAVKYL
jgi:hypothetical protein